MGVEGFKSQNLEKFIEFLYVIQTKDVDEDNDPQKSYLLTAWQMIVDVLKEKFAPFMDKIVPSLFKMIGSIASKKFDNGISELGVSDMGGSKSQNIVTYDTEEAENAIRLVLLFTETVPGPFAKYANAATELLIPISEYTYNQNIRQLVA